MTRLLLYLFLSLLGTSLAHEGKGPPTDLLKRVFPTAEGFVTKDLKLAAPELRSRVEARLGYKLTESDLKTKAYVATVRGRSIGAAWATELPLGTGFADVAVGLDLDGRVVGVAVDHSPIPALAQPGFLSQFQGQNGQTVGQNLRPPAGQAAAGQKLASSVRTGVVVLTEALLNRKGN